MKILAIDTAAKLCAACVLDTEAGELGREVLDLGKGHAERLMGVIGSALDAARIAYGGLDAIAVSVGPGSFTGVRVGVATARGLALALNIPAVGVTTLEALALEARRATPGKPVLAAIDAGRGQAYVALFAADGSPERGAQVLSVSDAEDLVRRDGLVLVGSAAALLAGRAGVEAEIAGLDPTADIGSYARIAAARLADGAGKDLPKPRPLYLREADAKPQSDFALSRRDGK
ncbi:tRNA (adenosine(37)-N6)-threonylcarbamoyltransferase complex dimerization subunit type 1 TsaB [Aquamicrobium sp. LC103]|uniref:tRNA (adenosine(37)-N6)-threonylcarbamoyltransferase complex dimerization subunit type 1 TsaB n=1 Tax=Aquamicrobium sp. LC103 TaxID=1120658 RepID=UPI00063E6E66|nr:tRNA (adenosine(37)-N6)-threonylcarbamoyltransferase complex dimerization subunit type 1 TsaB [Aquamicrobium sp. LC103]TKT74867.1 tRNA (adenosine(37)-N6)-threonylcarbamoyltransferase complex dimerization subunit type 1 TsaB [Aquamicrobium sp. LC103]